MMFERPVVEQFRQRVFSRLDAEGVQFLAVEFSYESETRNAALIELPSTDLLGVRLNETYPFFRQLNLGFPPAPPLNPKYARDVPEVYIGELSSEFVVAADRPVLRVELPAGRWRILPIYLSFRSSASAPWFPIRRSPVPEGVSRVDIDGWLYVQGFVPDNERYRRAWQRSRFEFGAFVVPSFCASVVDERRFGWRCRIEGERPNEDIRLIGEREPEPDQTIDSAPVEPTGNEAAEVAAKVAAATGKTIRGGSNPMHKITFGGKSE